jgi:hypothetical protein
LPYIAAPANEPERAGCDQCGCRRTWRHIVQKENSMAVNKVGASTASRTGSPRPHAVEENGKPGIARTPRLREAEGRRVDTASSSPRRIDASKTPTLELRRLAAEEGLLPRSPRRDSPRPESPRAPASPQPQPQPRPGKRAGDDVDAGDAPQRKKARTDADGAQAGAATASSSATRPRAGSSLKALFRKEKKPSSDELRCDPDEEGGVGGEAFQPQAARLPRGGSIIFSRGAIETTLLDSTTEADAESRPPSGAPGGPGAATDNG